MNNKEIILLGLGFLVGYMVIKASRNNNIVASKNQTIPKLPIQTETTSSTNTELGTTQIKEPEVVEAIEDPKIIECKEKWIKFSETKKFNSQEQLQKTYDNFMTSCVVQS
jgi:hypothetical protein